MSQRITLDFVDNSPYRIDQLGWFSTLLLLLGLVSAVYVYQQYQTAQQENAMAKLALHDRQPQPKKMKAPQVSATLPAAELKQVNATATALAMPWGDLFAGLEQLPMRDVALLSIEPSVKKQRLTLTGQAKNMRTVLHYVERVESLPMLSRVYLQKHNVEQEHPFKPVSFTVVATW